MDFDKVRSSDRAATFNLYNFTTHQLEVCEPSDITEELLISGVSLPIWFPAVTCSGHDYIDAVYASDANLIEAIRRGADELWVIWTVSERSEWKKGFIAQYFQIIEAAANGRFRADLARIEHSNAEIAAGRRGEFDRPIGVKILRAEVPLHYLLNFRSSKFTEAVDMGVQFAREWCRQHEIPLRDGQRISTTLHEPTYLEFTETMKGEVVFGNDEKGTEADRKAPLIVRLTIQVDNIDEFVADPEHLATAQGYVDCPTLGGRCAVENGEFNLFVDQDGDNSNKRMLYRLPFTSSSGERLVLIGHKKIHDDPGFDLWSDTTTLFTQIIKSNDEQSNSQKELAVGVITIHMLDFLRQLTTFRTRGPSLAARMAGLSKFGTLFMGALWSVYRGDAEKSALQSND
jgi:hypothetical protein